jgi:hypothetical protein
MPKILSFVLLQQVWVPYVWYGMVQRFCRLFCYHTYMHTFLFMVGGRSDQGNSLASSPPFGGLKKTDLLSFDKNNVRVRYTSGFSLKSTTRRGGGGGAK